MSAFSYSFLAPPTVLITLCLAGAVIALKRRRSGVVLTLISALLLFAAATPALSSFLLRRVEAGLPQHVDYTAAQAIVVLGGDVRFGNGADIPDALGPLSAERVLLAAAAKRRLDLPIAVTGGSIGARHSTEAALMAAALESGFGIAVKWNEDRSRTTWENAVYTARLLQPDNIRSVILVSQAWHLPRAIWCFEQAGLVALPWPAPRRAQQAGSLGDFLPSVAALHDTFYAVHEMLGSAYYRWRY